MTVRSVWPFPESESAQRNFNEPRENRMRHSEARSEWVWMSWIGLFLCLPLALTIYSRLANPPAWLAWLQKQNVELVGVETARPRVAFSQLNLLKGDYQRDCASAFDREFIPRGGFIKLICELDYRLFRTSPLKSGGAVVGREDQLYQVDYLKEYFLYRRSHEDMARFVAKVQALHQQCQSRGIALAFVLTPSKASVYPEDLPPAWRKSYDPRPRAYDQLVPLLRSAGIPVVDGHALTLDAKQNAPAPVFPKGGVHWSAHAASLTTSAILATLRQQGKPLSELQYESVEVHDDPVGRSRVPGTSDADMLGLMNLAIPWRYPVARPTIKRFALAEDAKLKVAFVGGSFSAYLADQLYASGQFAEINLYFYYNLARWNYSAGGWKIAASPVNAIDVEREIFGADCLILELNEQVAPWPQHLPPLLADTRSHLGPPANPKPGFRYESYQEYELGTDISLKLESASATTPYIGGFFAPEPTGTWTDGHEATVRLVVSPPATDLVLDADVVSFASTKQYAEVFANETLVGKWRFPAAPIGQKKAVIPKEAIGSSGRLILRFVIPEPRSLRQLGIMPDDRPLGVSISRLRISAEDELNPETYKRYELGTDISLKLENAPAITPYLTGFFPPEPTGTWTDGNEATIQLAVAPPGTDLVLDADVLSFGSTEQYAEVFANKTLVGKWRFTATQTGQQRAVIPKEAIASNGKLVLRFVIPEPRSLRQLGIMDDDRPIGVAISRIRISAAEGQ
jgi:hypothetical protein